MFRDPRAMLGLLVVCAMVAWAMVLLVGGRRTRQPVFSGGAPRPKLLRRQNSAAPCSLPPVQKVAPTEKFPSALDGERGKSHDRR